MPGDLHGGVRVVEQAVEPEGGGRVPCFGGSMRAVPSHDS